MRNMQKSLIIKYVMYLCNAPPTQLVTRTWLPHLTAEVLGGEATVNKRQRKSGARTYGKTECDICSVMLYRINSLCVSELWNSVIIITSYSITI